MPIDISNFEVGETPYREYGGTSDFVNAQMQNRRFEYQKQRQDEENTRQDIEMIDKGTSLKGKSTGVPEINRTYDKLTESVVHDLISKAGKVPMTQLYGEMHEKMTPILQGYDAATNDMKLGNELANNITTQAKQLDKERLMNDITERVKRNYLNDDGTHKDVSTVRPTDYSDILNPDYLTKYATGTDALSSAFSADKGVDLDWKIKHPNGSEQTLRAKVPEYIQPSVSRDELIGNNLFVPKGKSMGFEIKGEDENGIKLFDKGLMGKYINDLPTQIAFNKAFKDAHPEDLSKLTQIQKENLQRAFLADFAKKGFSVHDAGTYHPPISHTTNNFGTGGGGGEAKGNLIDKIDLSYYGNPQQGRIDNADIKIIPADLQAVLKASGIDISAGETFQIEIENGRPVAITPEGGKRIDRVAIANAQKKFNTEGQKQVQPDFETVTPRVKQPDGGQPKQKEETRVDLKSLDPNGFKKEGKYWKYKDGRLFDDNGNLIKQ